MKTEPKLGDYVGFKKPYVGGCPIGIVAKIIILKHNVGRIDASKPMYEVRTPDGMSCWRQAIDLKKASLKSYKTKNLLARLEKEE